MLDGGERLHQAADTRLPRNTSTATGSARPVARRFGDCVARLPWDRSFGATFVKGGPTFSLPLLNRFSRLVYFVNAKRAHITAHPHIDIGGEFKNRA